MGTAASRLRIALISASFLFFGIGVGQAAERKLADMQPFSAFLAAGFTCRPDVTVTVRAPDDASFTTNRVELQKLVGGVRAILGFECQTSPITTLVIIGESGGRQVYRGEARATANWLLTDIRTPPQGPSPVLPAGAVGSGEPISINDPEYYFSATIPAGWHVTLANDPRSFLRASGKSPGGDEAVSFFALRELRDIDLEKLADDSTLFGNLGTLTKTRRIRAFWPLRPRAIEKSYDKNGQGFYTLGWYKVSGTYGYIILADGKSPDFSTARTIFDSFDTHVPFYINWKNKLSFAGIELWLVAVGGALLLGGTCFVLSKSGQLIRRGVETKRDIERHKLELMQKHEPIDYKKYSQYKRKALLLIFGPLAGWGVVYCVIAAELPVEVLLISFLAIFVIVAGYFGITFKPKIPSPIE